MARIILSSAAALGLLMTPALAQDTGTSGSTMQPSATDSSSTDSSSMSTDSSMSSGNSSGSAMSADASGSMASDQAAHDSAMKSAEGVGMQNVRILDRVFVVEGTTEAGRQVYMIVNPPGALIGIGAPIVADASAGSGSSGIDTTTTSSTTPTAGEPADSGYMATQAHPASAQMWDPEIVENSMQDLGLDTAE